MSEGGGGGNSPPRPDDPAAELLALQRNFDDYVASSRELEVELDAELTHMQRKLDESSRSNAALASQLESVTPQLSALEVALEKCRAELDAEVEARRKAESAQDEAENRCRAAEGTAERLREENDELHEELAFRSNELDDVRHEVEDERERHRVEMETLRSDLSLATSKSSSTDTGGKRVNGSPGGGGTEQQHRDRALSPGGSSFLHTLSEEEELKEEPPSSPTPPREGATTPPASPQAAVEVGASAETPTLKAFDDSFSSPAPAAVAVATPSSPATPASPGGRSTGSAGGEGGDDDAEYIRSLEDELELVTEQLIDAQSKLTEMEDRLGETERERERAESDLAESRERLKEAFDAESSRDDESSPPPGGPTPAERVEELEGEVAALNEELRYAREELTLTREELEAVEEDAKDSVRLSEEAVDRIRAELDEVRAEMETMREKHDVEIRTRSEEAVEEVEARHAEQVEALEGRLRDLQEERSELRRRLEEGERERAAASAAAPPPTPQDPSSNSAVAAGGESAAHWREKFLMAERDAEAERSDLRDRLEEARGKLSEMRGEVEKELQSSRDEVERLTVELDRVTADHRGALDEVARLRAEDGDGHGREGRRIEELELELRATREELRELEGRRLDEKEGGVRNGTTSSSSSVSPGRRGDDDKRLRQLEEQCSLLRRQSDDYKECIKLLETQLAQRGEGGTENGSGGVVGSSPVVAAPPPIFSPASRSTVMVQADHQDILAIMDSEVGSRVEEALRSRDPRLMRDELAALSNKCLHQREHNAQLLNRILALQGNIQVCCRIRPIAAEELSRNVEVVVEPLSETEVGCLDEKTKIWKSYAFDKVWGPDQHQQEVFQDVEPLALSVVDGYNACIFAYGQTGSGKTYTMEGMSSNNQYGVSQRTIQKIFHLLSLREQQTKSSQQVSAGTSQKTDGFTFAIEVGMLEIYNEEVYDLLAPEDEASSRDLYRKPSLDVRRDPDGRVVVPDLMKEEVTSLEDVMNLLRRGNGNRATASTNLNEHSSRSHMVLDVQVTSGTAGQRNMGHLYLVDLAGSERVRKSGVQGKELKEAQHINKSLSALGDVMEALDRKAPHVPYRNSKLTHLLKDCLGGNSKTMMVVTVNPGSDSVNETHCALQFATRVRRINLGAAQRNVSSKNQEERIKKLTEEVRSIHKAKERSDEQLLALRREHQKMQEHLATFKESRAKNHDEVRSLAVLRNSRNELLARYEKEKATREKKAADLDRCQKELRQLQQKELRASKERDHAKRVLDDTKKLLDDREQALSDTRKELRTTKDSLSAANLRARRAQIMQMAPKNTTVSVSNADSDNPKSAVLSKHNLERLKNDTDEKSSNVSDIREKVLVLLQRYDPLKAKRIDSFMEKFKGREHILLQKVIARYEGDVHSEITVDTDIQSVISEHGTRRSRAELALAKHKERMQSRRSVR